MYHIHIIPVGINPKPALSVMQSDMPVQKVHLICSEDMGGKLNSDMIDRLSRSEEEIVSTLWKSDIDGVIVSRVDPWDYQAIIDKVMDIAALERLEHPDAQFHINFTSGTHVTCGAVCSAAFYIGADLYYIMNRDDQEGIDDPVRRFQIPSLPDVSRIKGKTIDVLFLLEGAGWIDNSVLKEGTGMTSNKLGYHTRILREYGLIESKRLGKEVQWRLTYSGKVATKVIGRPMRKK